MMQSQEKFAMIENISPCWKIIGCRNEMAKVPKLMFCHPEHLSTKLMIFYFFRKNFMLLCMFQSIVLIRIMPTLIVWQLKLLGTKLNFENLLNGCELVSLSYLLRF